MTGLSVKVFRLTILFVTVVQAVWMAVTMPDLWDAKS
jgi:hypothetical protein